MTIAIIIVSGVVAILGFVFAILFVVRTAVGRSRARAESDPLLAGARHVTAASFGGGEGMDVPSVAGVGMLGIASDALVFVLGMPHRSLSIPLARITDVTLERTLRVPGRIRRGSSPWLMVHWTDGRGGAAKAGFMVPNGPQWQAELLGRQGGLGEGLR
jgi:hypothetical protein